MVIAICLKQVDYVYGLTGRVPDRHFIHDRDRVRFNNPADEEALAFAAQMKSRIPDMAIWVFSLGAELIPGEAARALAMGADHFVWLKDAAWEGLDAPEIGVVLAAAVKKAGADLILCGAAALDTGRGEVGPFLAHCLRFPFIPRVTKLMSRAGGKQIRIQHSLGRGDGLDVTASLPLVLTVARGTIQPRYPSHVQLIKARATPIARWGREDIGAPERFAEKESCISRVTAPRPRVKAIPLLDGDLAASDRVGWLLDGRGRNKAGNLVQGDAAGLSQALLDFLAEKGLWRPESPSGPQ